MKWMIYMEILRSDRFHLDIIKSF